MINIQGFYGKHGVELVKVQDLDRGQGLDGDGRPVLLPEKGQGGVPARDRAGQGGAVTLLQVGRRGERHYFGRH